MYDSVIKFAENNGYELSKTADLSNLEISKYDDDDIVKVKTLVITNPSDNSKSVEWVKLEGNRLPFQMLFHNLNEYLTSELPCVSLTTMGDSF